MPRLTIPDIKSVACTPNHLGSLSLDRSKGFANSVAGHLCLFCFSVFNRPSLFPPPLSFPLLSSITLNKLLHFYLYFFYYYYGLSILFSIYFFLCRMCFCHILLLQLILLILSFPFSPPLLYLVFGISILFYFLSFAVGDVSSFIALRLQVCF